MISYVRERLHERETMPTSRLARLCICRIYSPFNRGSNQKEISSRGAGSVGAKKPQDSKNPAAFISIFYLRSI